MSEINVVAVVAAAASFVASMLWYGVFGAAMMRLQAEWRGAEEEVPDRPPVWKLLGFFTTGLIIALCVAVLVGLTDISGWSPSLGLGVLLWVGFSLTQWISSILGEGVPWKLAAIHAGDWLLHLLIISVIVGVWR